MNITQIITQVTDTLHVAGVQTARLDSLLITGFVLGLTKAQLLARPEQKISPKDRDEVVALAKRRSLHEPIAYIIGQREFYGRSFYVDRRVLIPRPETENIITMVSELDLPSESVVVDIGTGSGCIGISLKLSLLCNAELWLLDTEVGALEVARYNAKNLGCTATTLQSNLLESLSESIQPTIVIANLPYVDHNFPVDTATRFEPSSALFANDNGFQLIEKLIAQASSRLQNGSYLVLEMDPWQQERVTHHAKSFGFTPISSTRFHLLLRK